MKLNKIKILFGLVLLAIAVIFFLDNVWNDDMDDHSNDESIDETVNNPGNNDTVNVESYFSSDKEKTQNDLKIDLLKEIGFCKTSKCPSDVFRLFPINKSDSLKNAFFLLVKAGVNGNQTRKLYVFKRIDNKLQVLNVFNGNLIQMINSSSGYHDIVVHFGSFGSEVIRDGGKFLYDCLFKWNGENYKYSSCEKINGSKIKPIYRDSISKDTYYFLKERKYF